MTDLIYLLITTLLECMMSHVGDAFSFIFTFLYFNVVCFHVCHCLDTGVRTGVVDPFLVLCLVLSYVSCTHHALKFLQGREVLLFMWCECLYCYQFCRKRDSGLFEIDFFSA